MRDSSGGGDMGSCHLGHVGEGDGVAFRLGQRPCLDGLRGFAVIAVLLAHLHVIPGGFIGVEALFVLSGFLITVLLIEEWEKKGAISLPNFYRKRFLRILPPLVALLAIASGVSVAFGYRTPTDMLRESAVAALFLANGQTLLRVGMPILGHTWTLALEVQFYLLWPVALTYLLRAKVRRERLLWLLAWGIAASMALRIVFFVNRPPSGPERLLYLMRMFMGLDTHADTLLIGCLAGALVAWNRVADSSRLRTTGWLSVGGLSYMLLRCHHEQYAFYCGLFTLTGVMVATVIAWLMIAPPRMLVCGLEWRPLVGLGRVSYSLYLFHMPILVWLRPSGIGPVALAFALSVVAAVASYYTIERPFIRAKNRPTPATVGAEIAATRAA